MKWNCAQLLKDLVCDVIISEPVYKGLIVIMGV